MTSESSRARPSLRLHVQAYLTLTLMCLGAIYVVDQQMGSSLPTIASRLQQVHARKPVAPSEVPGYKGSGHVFVLLIDSLRYQTATSPRLMPYLYHMRKKSAYAEMETVMEAVTLPALRSAFSGHTVFRVLDFVKIFSKEHKSSIPSLFTDLKRQGRRAAVFSDPWSFSQFGKDITDFREIKGPEIPFIQKAINAYQSRKYQFVLYHLHAMDKVAHHRGIYHPAYQAVARTMDGLIALWDRIIPPQDTYIIIGDHGHTENGTHSLGQHVPTYLSIRGPGFRQGTDLGRVHISSMYYFLNWALKLPLPASYPGVKHPQAFVQSSKIPQLYRQQATAQQAASGSAWKKRQALVFLALYIGIFLFLWLDLLHKPGRYQLLPGIYLWLSPLLWFLAPLSPWSVGINLTGGALCLLWQGYHTTRRKRFALAALGLVAAALGFVGWGYVLGEQRVNVHYPTFTEMRLFWLYCLLGATVLSFVWSGLRMAWVFLLIPGLFFYVTVLHYGFVWVLVPAWLCWGWLAILDKIRSTKGQERLERKPLLVAGLLLLCVFFLIQPYFTGDAPNFTFERYMGWVELFLVNDFWVRQMILGLCCLLLYMPTGRDIGMSMVAFLLAIGHYMLITTQVFGDANYYLSLIALLLLIIAFALRVIPRFARAAVSYRLVLGIGALFLLFRYTVNAPLSAYQGATIFLAALILTTRMMLYLQSPQATLHSYYLYFLVLGVLISGAVTLQWCFAHVEWNYIFDFLTVNEAYAHPILVFPLIAFRYALPMLMISLVLRRELPHTISYPGRAIHGILGVKTALLVLVSMGLSLRYFNSMLYLECMQHIVIFLLVWLGLFGFEALLAAQSTDATTR